MERLVYHLATSKSWSILKRREGFSSLQALVVGAVVLAMGGAILSNQSNMYKAQNRMTAGVARFNLSENLRFNASSPWMLYKSAKLNSTDDQNSPLAACICGETTCLPDQVVDIDLVDVADNILAGPSSARKKYTVLSEFCDANPSRCVFEGEAQFACMGSNCGTDKAVLGNPSLKVSYNLKLTPFAKITNREFSYLKDTRGDVSVSVTDPREYGKANDICVTGSSFSPVYSLTSGGGQLVISGTGLQRVKSVLLDNSSCAITSRSNKQLTCTIPSHWDGYVPVILQYGSGQIYKLSSSFLYYTPPPPPPPDPEPPPGGGGGGGDPATGKWKTTGPVFGPCCSYPPGPCYVGETRNFGHGSPSVCQ